MTTYQDKTGMECANVIRTPKSHGMCHSHKNANLDKAYSLKSPEIMLIIN